MNAATIKATIRDKESSADPALVSHWTVMRRLMMTLTDEKMGMHQQHLERLLVGCEDEVRKQVINEVLGLFNQEG